MPLLFDASADDAAAADAAAAADDTLRFSPPLRLLRYAATSVTPLMMLMLSAIFSIFATC